MTTPDQYARDIAANIVRLAEDPQMRVSLGREAQKKVLREGRWQNKADRMLRLYEEISKP